MARRSAPTDRPSCTRSSLRCARSAGLPIASSRCCVHIRPALPPAASSAARTTSSGRSACRFARSTITSLPDGRLLHHLHHRLHLCRRRIRHAGPVKVPRRAGRIPISACSTIAVASCPSFRLRCCRSPGGTGRQRAAQGAGVCVDHVVVPLLAIVAGQIGAARRIEAVPAWGERLGLWTTLVGFSGTGKTPGLNATKRVLEAVERDRADRMAELRRQHETRVETARAAYKRWKEDVAAGRRQRRDLTLRCRLKRKIPVLTSSRACMCPTPRSRSSPCSSRRAHAALW